MVKTEAYILGVEEDELGRLGVQHSVWVEWMHRSLYQINLRAGERVLDLGCGPGFTSLELARFVGPEGHVLALDQDEGFLQVLRRQCEHQGLGQVEARRAKLEDFDVPEASFDAAFGRWIFCWLPEPRGAMEHVARALKPGGRLVLHEYLDWAAMKLLPDSPAFSRAVDACMESWRVGEATINFAEEVPRLADEVGLSLERVEPIARVGSVGALEWRWIGGFFSNYLPKLVEQGLLSASEFEAWRKDWQDREQRRSGYCVAPTVANLVLVKPD